MPAEILVDQRPSISFSSISGLLEHHAKRNSDALAILAPGRATLSYGQLYKYIEEVGRTLRAMGFRATSPQDWKRYSRRQSSSSTDDRSGLLAACMQSIATAPAQAWFGWNPG
jgi:hypothetical protein